MRKSVLIVLAVFVVVGLAAAAISFMQGAGVEREVSDPEAVEAQPTLR